jgi:hypothetical protein
VRITCKEATRLMSLGLDSDLGFADRVALRLHLALCSACNVMRSQFEFMRRALSTYSRGGREDE